MTLAGTIVNGHVQLDAPTPLPDGTRVSVKLAELDEYPHPLAPYDREKELALLRERLAAVAAGERLVPLAEAMKSIAQQLKHRDTPGD